MAAQSRTKMILLTRPEAQSLEFARALRERFDSTVSITISPLLCPEFLTADIQSTECSAVVFTSQTAVEAARRISARGILLPRRAFCVGRKTASAARKAGFAAVSADSDAKGLIDMIRSSCPSGGILHLRGEVSNADLAKSLVLAGIEATETVVYRQVARSLSPEAVDLTTGNDPVFVPLFSPRSAELFAAQIKPQPRCAPLYLATISSAVADHVCGLQHVLLETAPSPDAEGMLNAIAALFAQATGP